MMEFEGQNNDFGGTKRYNNTPLDQRLLKALVPPNSFGPPPMGAVGLDLKDRGSGPLLAVCDPPYMYSSSVTRNARLPCEAGCTLHSSVSWS